MPPHKGFQPQYVGGRPNRFYTGNNPQSTNSILQEDLINIGSDFDVATRKAARALYRGDRDEYSRQLEKSSAIYAAYEKYNYLTQQLEEQEEITQEWMDNYQNFREDNHLDEQNYDEVAHSNLDLNEVTRQYSSQYEDDDVKEAIAHAEIEYNNIVDVLGNPQPRQEYVDKYQEKIKGKKPQSSTVNSDAETQEIPIVDPYDDNNDYVRYGKPLDDQGMSQKKHKVNNNDNNSSSSQKSGKFITDMEECLGVADSGSFVPNIRKKVGPLRFNFGRRGLSSVVVDSGPVNFMAWSRDYEPGVSSVKMPVGYYRPKKTTKSSTRVKNKDFLNDYDTHQLHRDNFLIRGLKNFFRA